MSKSIKGWFEYNQDIFVINIILVIKVLIFMFIYGSVQNLFWLVGITLAILLILSVWAVLLPSLLRQSALLLLDISITLLLITDLIFMRFFDRPLPILAFYQADQLSGISSSILNLFSIIEFLLFLDLILIVPYLAYVYSKQKKHQVKFRFKLVQVAIILLLSTGFIFFKADKIVSANGKEVITEIYMNDTILNNMGVLNFHLADLYNTLKTSKGKTLSRNDILALRAWNESYQSTEKDFYGSAIGKNLIIIQMESTQNFLINSSVNGQEVTPNLNKLVENSMYFDNYFVQVSQGNSSDAEFMTFNSLYPLSIGASFLIYPENDYLSLPSLLKDIGYNTFVIHGDVAAFWGREDVYPNMGIDRYLSREQLEEGKVIGMGLADEDVFTQAIPIIEQAKKPFLSMIITLSSHHPFVIPKSEQDLNIPQGEYTQLFSDYLQSQHYADKQIGFFIDELDNKGILDNSLLVLYGDHFGTGWTDSDIQKFLSLSEPLNEYQQMELRKVPLLIRLPQGQNAGVNHQSGGQMDLMPTIANLMGIEGDRTIYFGQDLLNAKDGFTVFRYYAVDGSFATNDYIYLGSTDGVFEHGHAYDRRTGQEIEVEMLREKYNEAKKQLELSDLILKGNAIPDIVISEN